jgi:oligoribonuclease NrnB/cAMP/cGMP phosphodiesterase (DHH superfamily)
MKAKLLTHTDLDGVGCSVLGQAAFGDDIDVEYCDHHNINERVTKLLDESLHEYDVVFITDISVNEEVAEKIQTLHENGYAGFQLLDHHDTANWLNKYDWAYVSSVYQEEDRDYKTSGTSLLLDCLSACYPDVVTSFMIDFAEQVRRYDTWEWSTVYKEVGPKELNDLMSILGHDAFMSAMLKHNGSGSYVLNFSEPHRALLDQRAKEISGYIYNKMKQVKVIKLDGHSVGVVFAEKNASELGNEIAEKIEGIDYSVVLNTDRLSASFRGIKDDIDLGLVAKKYGGGGHPRAAGATFKKLRQEDLIKLFFVSMTE